MSNFKRFLSLVVALVMVIGMVPGTVFATTEESAAKGVEVVIIGSNGEIGPAWTDQSEEDGTKIGDALELAMLNTMFDIEGLARPYTYKMILQQDIEVSEMTAIPADTNVVLDLNGHKITSGYQAGSDSKHLYPLSNYGTLTIQDSVGTGSITGRGIYNQDGAKLTVNGAKIVAEDWNGGAGVWSFGTGEVYLNNATIIGNTGVVSSEGYLEINGGTYTCYSGIDDEGTQRTSPTYNIRAYNGLKITDGTFTSRHGVISLGGGEGVIEDGSYTIQFTAATTSNVVYVYDNAKLTIEDGAFLSDNTSGKADSGAAVLSYGSNSTVIINDGEFVGMNGMVSTNANTVINGGSFDTVWNYNHYGNIESAVATGAKVTVAGTTYTKTENGLEEYKAPAAKIGEQGFATLAEALAAAATMTGDVTVEIYDKVTLAQALTGSFNSIKFVGKDADAEIYIDIQGAIYATGKKAAFEDLKLSKVAGGYIADAGFRNLAFGLYGAEEVTYTGCTFVNGAYASSGKETYTNCTFYRSHDRYGMWVYGDVDVTVDGCTFADIRGIKMYDEGKASVGALTVKNTSFSAVTGKPAIVLTYGESVTLAGNTYNAEQGVFELDLDGAPNGTPVTSDVAPTCKNDNGACGVLADGKIYTTVAQAAEVATSGSKVILLHNSAENVELAEGVELNKNGFAAEGVTVKVAAPTEINSLEDLIAFREAVNGGNNYAGVTVTLKADIDLAGAAWTPIGTTANPFKGTFNGGNNTISNLVVSGEDNVGFFGYADGCSIKNLKINNATVTGVDCVGGIAGQVYSTSTIDNCHVSGAIKIEGQTNVGGIVGKYYVKVSNSSVIGDGAATSYVKGTYFASDLEGDNIGGIMGHGGEANNFVGNTVKNITIIGTRKVGGIVGTTNRTTNVTGCTVENVVVTTNATADYAAKNSSSMDLGGLIGHYYNSGSNGVLSDSSVSNVTFVTNGLADAGTIVGGDRSTPDTAPVGVTASNITVSNVTGATNKYLMPTVAQIGSETFSTLAEAVAEAVAGDEIVLLADVTEDVIVPDGVIFNGNGKQVNGTLTAGGDLTINGHTKVTGFSAGYYNHTITIGEGACLELTGTGRVTVSYGNVFNITGSIENAKTAANARALPQASLIVPGGLSFNGNGGEVQFNVTDAYVVLGDSSTKNSGATGEFNMNFTNSIVDFTKTLKTYMPTVSGLAPVFNFAAKDSVIGFASHMELWLDDTNMTLDNTDLTVGGSFANAGAVNVTNNSNFVVKAPIMSSHGGNTGDITVSGGTFELVDSNEDWQNAGTMTATGNGKLVTNDFKNVGEGKLVLDSANASIVGKADLGITTEITNATVKYDEATKTYIVELPDVAQVGSTKYKTIDEAIAAWTNNTTLTLLADVTLSDVITLKSTEHHTLDLGTYTMTAASGKHAIEITCEGRSSASYALTINADDTNPGGITATGKSCIYYSKSGSTKDRPIIRIYNGVFNGSYSINSKSNGNTNCPQIWIYGGTFNGNVNLTKNMLRVFGGTFNGWINCTGDSSAYREISGGRFKSWQFMTADADSKFWVGTSKANYNVGCYVDDEGYLVVGGDVVTEAGDKFEASSANYGGWSSYLKYSSANENGLYYTSAEEAFADNNKATGSVTVYVDELDMTGISYNGTIVLDNPEAVITYAEGTTPTWKVYDAAGNKMTESTTVVDGKIVASYFVPVAKIGDTYYATVAEAIKAAKDGDIVTILPGEYGTINISNKNITIEGTVGDNGELLTTIKGGNPAITGHGFNGTIKNLKVVDAWKVMYAEPAGNVTVDNVYVTGATYGFHLVAYSKDIAWTIQNSYMDLAWANSFGVHGNGDAQIVIQGNKFDSKNPYYPDYGALAVNTFLPNVTVKENVFGENTKIYVDKSVTDTSKIVVTKNYHADGVENAFADDAVKVGIPAYYTGIDANGNLTNLVECVAKIGDTYYATLQDAFKAATEGCTIEILSDVTVTEAWDCRDYATGGSHSQFKESVTINGNGHTIKFTGTIKDNNWDTVFRFEENATVKNLTVDISEATGALRVISAKKSLSVDDLTIIGSAKYGVIFGEGASAAELAAAEIAITNSTLTGTRRAISDNEGGKDVKSVAITNSAFENTNVAVSAFGSVTFTGNTISKGEVDIRSYTDLVDVVATDNTLTDGATGKVSKAANYDNIQPDFTSVAPVEVNGKKFASLQAALDAAAAGTGAVEVNILEDVNLENVDWNPVNVSAPGYPVITVNGNDHTITGLNDMLFASTWAGNSGLIINDLTIKDSKIENDVNDTKGSVGVGAFVGYPQASATITLNNCHLVNSTVSGGHWTGGLIGMAGGYNGTDGPVFMNLTITDCSVTGSTITGKGSVGGVIGHGSCSAWTNVVIENTTVSGNTITSTGSSTEKAGSVMGTIGAAGQEATVNGVSKTGGASVSATVSGNIVTSSGTVITTVYGRQGTSTGTLEITGGAYSTYPVEENVSYAYPAEGCELKYSNGAFKLVPVTVASVGGVGYPTLQAAIDAAKDGETIYLLADIATTEGMTVPAGKAITLDLKGQTITGTDNATGSFGLITNKGNLTIKDSVGNGKITLKATNNRGWSAYSSVISNQPGGKLTVESGVIEHLGGSDMAYGIDNLTNGKGTYAEVVIKGGTVKSPYRAIRQFLNGTEAHNILTVNGGIIEGANKAIWMQDPSANANSGKLTVGAGAQVKGDVYLDVTEGSTEWPVEIAIAAAALQGESEVLTENIPQQYVVENVGGIYGVTELDPVAKIGDALYYDLAEAMAAAKAGEIVTLLADVTVEATNGGYSKAGVVVNGQILDGNGHTLTVTGADATWDCGVYITAGTVKNLTVKGSFRGVFTAGASANIYLDNVDFKNVVYTFNSDAGNKDYGVYISNSKLNGWTSFSDVHKEVVFTNCEFGEGSGYAFCRPYNTTVFDGCTFSAGYDVDGSKAEMTFKNMDAESAVELVDGAVAMIKNGDSVTFYNSLPEAMAAAKAGEIVTLLADVTVEATNGGYSKAGVVVNGQILDGNGHTLTVTGADATWDCGVYITAGTVKNLTVKGSFRGVFTAGASANIYLDNVDFKNVVYTFNSDAGNKDYGVYISNSKLNGWTSFSDVHKEVVFTNCEFGEGSGYAFCRPYNTTVFDGCTFSAGYDVDGSKAEMTFKNMDAESAVELVDGAVAMVENGTETTFYPTWAEAMAAAQAGDTITLLADVEASEVILIDKSLTINGNGHKVTSSATRVFRVTTSNVDVTINDLNMVNTKASSYTADIRGISVDASLSNVKLTLNDCSVDFTDASACDWAYAVNVSGSGTGHTVTVNGGSYEGANVINAHGANNTIVVYGATLTSLYPNDDVYYGACIYVAQDENSAVTATGNTFNGSNAVAFNVGYTPVTESNNTDNTTRVVAKVGNTYYTSLAGAMAAAQTGEAVTIFAGEYTGNLNVNKAITVVGETDAEGNNLVNFKGKLSISADGATVKNLNFNNGSNSAGYIGAKNVLVEGCTVVGGNGFRNCYTSGTVTFKDSIITGSTYGIHFDGSANGNIVIDNCVITGWTSFAASIDKVTMSDTEFAEGSYNYIRFYQDAEITNCEFNDKMSINIAVSDAKITATGGLPVTGMSGYEVVYANGEYSLNKILVGSGTEADPFLIKSVEDLEFFRASVNAGETRYNAPGVWVALAADIDMAGATWERGIGDGINATFDGIFDGKNHTIKNLNMAPKADSDGYFCGGLFGYTYGAAEIKNLVLENITVTATGAGHNVGALVGFANNKGGKLNVSNVTVKNVTIDAPNAYGVGAIVGYSYRAMGTIENCSVDGATITGYSFVGGITGYSYADAVISGCSVKNATITATSKGAGGIAGLVQSANVSGNTVTNTTVTAPTNWGYVIGEVSVEGVVVANNNAAEPQVGGSYATGEPVEARIGSKYYTTLEAALEAAAAGETIELLVPIVVEADEEVVIDLAGKTISYVSNVPGEDMITNYGKLTIDDSVGGGKITYTNTDNTANNVTVSTISCEPGSVLNVNGGTVENKTVKADGSSIYPYAIDMLTNGNMGDVTVNVTGGTIYSDYMAIRQFNNGAVCKNTLNVTGGTIYGARRAIQVHFKNNAAYTTISGGVIEGGDYSLCLLTTSENLSVTGGQFKGEVWYSGTKGFISGGLFDAEPYAAYIVEGLMAEQVAEGVYGIVKAPAGKIAYRAYVNDSNDREAIGVDLLNVYAKESLVIKLLDANGNVLTTTSLKAGAVDAENYTANIVLWGKASGSWDTEIHEELTIENAPATIKLYADGTLVDTYENALGAGTNVDESAKYQALDCVYKAAKVGDTYYTTLGAAIDAARDGDTIYVFPGEISEKIAPWAKDSTHASEKSITLLGAAAWTDGETILTGGMYLGYDDSQCRENTITVKGFTFRNKGILVASQQNVVIEDNKFENITACVADGRTANENAISVVGKNFNATIQNNVIDGAKAGGIHLRDTKSATVYGNTIANTGDNAITILESTERGAVVVENNKIHNWADNNTEGRAIRINGAFTSVDVNGNVMTHVDAPEEFVKITGAKELDASENYWSGHSPVEEGIFATNVAGTNAQLLKNYYTDAAKNNLVEIKETYVAQIGETGYLTLAEAIKAAQDGDTITLLNDIIITADTAGYSDGTYTDGVRYTGDKSFTVDFAGFTVMDDGCVNDYVIYMNNKGEKANEITFKNGTIASKNGCWSTVCVNSSAATQATVLNLDGMKIVNSNDAAYSGNLAVRVRDMAAVNVNKDTVIISDGASYGIGASASGAIVNINDGATVIQKNSGVSGGNSVFAAVGGKGVININAGATITSDKYGVHTMTTGTPVVNVKGGAITAPVALKASTNGAADQKATIYVTGGIINGELEEYTDNGKIVISGGTFSSDVTEYCVAGCDCLPDGNNMYVVLKHHNHPVEIETTTTAPTCTTKGSMTVTVYCETCDAVLETTTVELAMLEHEAIVTYPTEYFVDATCSAEGSKTMVVSCETCGKVLYKETFKIEKLAHTEETVAGKDATCTETGLTAGVKCSVCNEILVAQDEIPVKVHTYEAVVTAPAMGAQGYTTYTCSVCGDSYVDDYVDALTAAAKIGETEYATLQEAVNAATEGATIELLADGEIAVVNKKLTINRNGKTATVAAAAGLTVDDTTDPTKYAVVEASSVGGTETQEGVAYVVGAESEILPLQEALNKAAAAGGGEVRLVRDNVVIDGTVIIPTGVTLNVEAYTLTADYVIGVRGSKLGGVTDSSKNDGVLESGRIVVQKGNLILAETTYTNAKGQPVLPIWDARNNCYLFSAFIVNTDSQTYPNRGLRIDEENDEIYFQFKHQITGIISQDLVATNGLSDNDISVIIRLEWETNNGIAYQDFVYNDEQIKMVTGSYEYTFTLQGYSKLLINIDTLRVTGMIVTESGAASVGTVWTAETAK